MVSYRVADFNNRVILLDGILLPKSYQMCFANCYLVHQASCPLVALPPPFLYVKLKPRLRASDTTDVNSLPPIIHNAPPFDRLSTYLTSYFSRSDMISSSPSATVSFNPGSSVCMGTFVCDEDALRFLTAGLESLSSVPDGIPLRNVLPVFELGINVKFRVSFTDFDAFVFVVYTSIGLNSEPLS